MTIRDYDDPKTAQILVLVTPRTKRKLTRISKRTKKTLSAIGREAFQQYIADHSGR